VLPIEVGDRAQRITRCITRDECELIADGLYEGSRLRTDPATYSVVFAMETARLVGVPRSAVSDAARPRPALGAYKRTK